MPLQSTFEVTLFSPTICYYFIMDIIHYLFIEVNMNCRIIDDSSQVDLCKYTLSDDFGNEDAVEVGKFSKNSAGDWEFMALGEGHTGGIGALIKKFANKF